MLTHLRVHLAAVLAPVQQATLATHGPAGLLAHVLPCVADGLRLFVLLPRTSDHLVNLETSPTVLVVTTAWMVRGQARVLADQQRLLAPPFSTHPDNRWSAVIEVTPTRIDVAQLQGWGAAETFDLEQGYKSFDR